jgi:hypothetical protein
LQKTITSKKEGHMSELMGEQIKRWTAKRKSALVLVVGVNYCGRPASIILAG